MFVVFSTGGQPESAAKVNAKKFAREYSDVVYLISIYHFSPIETLIHDGRQEPPYFRLNVWYREEIRAIAVDDKVATMARDSEGGTTYYSVYFLNLKVVLHNGDAVIL